MTDFFLFEQSYKSFSNNGVVSRIKFLTENIIKASDFTKFLPGLHDLPISMHF